MSDIDEVKSRVNIVDTISAKVKLSKAGRNFKGLCPFHNERTPSFMVSPDRQAFHCFGCGKGGSVIDFVMEYEHLDFVEALEVLAEKAGVTLERGHDHSPDGKIKTAIYEVNHLASEYYHYLLMTHALGEPARVYLRERGVSEKSMKTFALGYSANSWEALYRYLRKKGYEDELLVKAGLVLASQQGGSYYDRFRGRVMFTLKDHRGNVVGFAGRVLDKTVKDAKYINTSETPVYSKSNVLYGLDVTKGMIQKEGDAIIMEGELDVISSFQAGISNVVAIKGSALTEGHVRLLKRYTERITFALDSDMAGDAASRRGIDIAERVGLDMRVVALPQGKDPDECAKENPIGLKQAIRDAMSIYDYLLKSALKQYDITTAFGKKKISEDVLPIMSRIENPIVQGHYIKQFATTLGLSEDTVVEGIRKVKKGIPVVKKSVTEASQLKPMSREDRLVIYLLALLLQGKPADLLEDLLEEIPLVDIPHLAVRQILTLVQEQLRNQSVFFVKDFADHVPAELLPTVDEALLWDISGLQDSEEAYAKEWNKVVMDLRRLILRKKIQELSTRIAEADSQDANLHEELKILVRASTLLEKSA